MYPSTVAYVRGAKEKHVVSGRTGTNRVTRTSAKVQAAQLGLLEKKRIISESTERARQGTQQEVIPTTAHGYIQIRTHI